MIHFSGIDIALILLYFVVILAVGFHSRRGGKPERGEGGEERAQGHKLARAGDGPGGNERAQGHAADFMLAGRSLTLPVFVATLVSTWYGGILGTGEYSYSYGLASWVIFGAPYYLFALIFALFLAGQVRATGLMTIPDKLAHHYGPATALLGAVLVFLLVTPAPYLLMLGVLMQLIFGLPLAWTILLATLASILYLIKGGFRSDVKVNVVEFLLMFLGFFLVVGFAGARYGGVAFLRHHLPPRHLTWSGGNPPQYILVWFFIALWTLVDPGFHQRCYAARDGATARRGILVSILFWMLFDFLTTSAGLYARALLPGLEAPIFSYPLLAEHLLPPAAKGIFFIGLLATIMSTLSSYTFIGGMTIGNDVAGRLVRWRRDRERTAGMRRPGSGFANATPGGSENIGGGSENIWSEIIRGGSENIWGGSENIWGGSENNRGGSENIWSENNRGGSENTPGGSAKARSGGETPAIDALVKRWTQIGLLLASLYGILLALALPSVVRIWYAVGTACIPGLLLPLMASYVPAIRLKPRFALAAMLGGWLLSLVWLLRGMAHAGQYWGGIEPMYPGLLLSLVIGLAGFRRAQPL